MSDIQIQLPEGKVVIDKKNDNFHIKLEPSKKTYILQYECNTSYTIELINKIIEIKGFGALCDDIKRDQLYSYIQKPLENVILSHFEKSEFKGKRILDFGCGAGNSTVILGRMFQDSQIVGVELSEKLLELAEKRKQFYNLTNVFFTPSKSETELPDNLGNFDFVILNAVYEHLLPRERKIIFPLLWNLLISGGHLIINETPHRWFPVETHTTEGFPLINYLPDKVVYFLVKRFSKKTNESSWNGLLRGGIRGGSVNELIKILRSDNIDVKLLKPSKLSFRDRIDVFDKSLADDRLSPFVRKTLYYSLKILKFMTGITLTPTLAFVLKKE